MTKTSVAKASLRLLIGCTVALLVAADGVAALAHGGGHNHGAGSNGDTGRHSGNSFGGQSIDGGYWRHHHHHHHHFGTGPGGLGKVHGTGSSHNPIIYHPPVKPVRLPIAGTGPAKLPSRGGTSTFCQLQEAGVKVNDHRKHIPGPCRPFGHH